MTVAHSNILNVFATPTEVFLKVEQNPRWLGAFGFIAVVSIIVAVFTAPFAREITLLALSQKLQPDQATQAVAMSQRFQYIGMAVTPLLLLLRWLVIAAVFYFLAILLGTEALKFKTVYAVVVYSEMILLLMGVINILVLYLKGIGSVHHITDLQAILGLDILLTDRSANLPLFTLLNSINVFSIWYLGTLTIGISVITNFSKLKSAVLVTSGWLLGVGFQVAFAAISMSVQ